ncbi:MAG: flavodoxin family protein [Eubacteriaceae bacterium]|nr:flavodoxin family protein [Eubacteriaceae bacterium]
MSNKILILNASPRIGGNCDALCDEFIRGAADAGNNTEKINLRDKNINYCIGCLVCQESGGVCAHNDDMSEILDKMIDADVIVLATPVYFYSMCAQLKTLIDRTFAKYTKIRNKKFYLLSTAGDTDDAAFDGTIQGFRNFLYCLPGAEEAGIILAGGVYGIGEIKNHKALEQAYRAGKNI